MSLLQTGARLHYLANAGVNSLTLTVATYYLWDGVNIIDTTGSTTGAGGVPYGTDPFNPTGPILPYQTWSYCGPKQNGEDIGVAGRVGAETFFTFAGTRTVAPDWWMFKRGDVFDLALDVGVTGSSSLSVPGGATAAGVQVVGEYGPTTSPRPQFIHPDNGFIFRNLTAGRTDFKNAVYRGLHFNGHNRATGVTFIGLRFLPDPVGASSPNILIEDVWFDGTAGVLPAMHAGDVRFRRCIVADNWYPNTALGHVQGFSMSANGDGVSQDFVYQIDDCITYRNGFTSGDPSLSWPPSGGALDYTIFCRNFYVGSHTNHKESRITNTVSLIGGSGDQYRNGWRAEGNFVYAGFLMMNGYGGNAQPNSGVFRNNVMQVFRATGPNSNAHPAWGLIFGHSLQGVQIDGNIVTRAQMGRLADGFAGVWFKVINDDFYYPLTRTLRFNTVTDNIFDCGNSTSGVQIDDQGQNKIGWVNPGLNGNSVVRNVFAKAAGAMLLNTVPNTGIGSDAGTGIAFPGSYTTSVTFPVFGQMEATLAEASTPPMKGTNAGNGLLGGLAAIGTPPSETWTLTAINPITFQVVGSVSGVRANATVGAAYNNGLVSFTLTAGSAAWVAGDTWTFTCVFGVTPSDTYIPLTGTEANREYLTMAAAATAEGWIDANRTLKTYLQALGISVTSSDGLIEYVSIVAGMRRGTWRKDMQAKAIVNYIRQGFGKPALA